MEKFRPKIIWTSKSEYVDLDTGEVLTKQEVKKNYIIKRHGTEKTINRNSTHGRILHWYECKKHPQTRLF